MPIYEYYCPDCHKIFQFFIRNVSIHQPPPCPVCQRAELDRQFSRFAVVLGEERRLEKMADPSKFTDLDENDPKSMARWMKKMSRELGEEDLGPEFEEMIGRLEAGESPEDIEGKMGMPGMGPPPTDSKLYEA